MNRYEQMFDTEWTTLGIEEATEHAYAIGVANQLGENNRGHLKRIYSEMDTAYEKSMVELAFKKGRQEATKLGADGSLQNVWDSLVGGDSSDFEGSSISIGGRNGLPEALRSARLLDRIDLDSKDAMNLPEFLEG